MIKIQKYKYTVNLESMVFFWRITFYIFCLAAMDLAAFSMDCDVDLGDRMAFIVTLVLTFVAFSDTLFSLIPDISYLTFLVLFNYFVICNLCVFCFLFHVCCFVVLLRYCYVMLDKKNRRGMFWHHIYLQH